MLLAYAMKNERSVRLFRNGRNQAVRIPREFELPGDDAVMRKEGERLKISLRSQFVDYSSTQNRWLVTPEQNL